MSAKYLVRVSPIYTTFKNDLNSDGDKNVGGFFHTEFSKGETKMKINSHIFCRKPRDSVELKVEAMDYS